MPKSRDCRRAPPPAGCPTPRPSLLVAVVAALAAAGCQDKQAVAQADVTTARALYERHDLAGALTAVDKAIKADPRNRSAHRLAAEIKTDLGDLSGAVSAYDRVDLLDPTDKTARLKTVDLLIKANILDAAAARVNAAIAEQPNNIDAQGYRALIEARQGKFGKARLDAQAVLSKAPSNASAIATLAELALHDGRPDDAVAQLKAGLAKAPDDPTLLLDLVSLYQAGNQPGKALDTLAILVKSEPTSPVYRMLQAAFLASQGRADAGEKTLRDGLALAPQGRPMRLGLSGYLEERGRTAEAEAVLREGIALDANDAVFDLSLADLLVKTGRLGEAATLLRTAGTRLEDKPAGAAAKLGLARVLAAQGQTAEALSVLDALVKAKATDDAALMLRADILLRTGQADRAVADLTAVTAHQPTNAAAFDLLARGFDLQGKADEALDALRRSADLRPAEFERAQRVADAESKLGKTADAKAVLADFVTRNPTSIEGRTAEIRGLLTAGDWTAAQGRIDQLASIANGTNVALALTGEMKEMRGLPAEALPIYKQLVLRPGIPNQAREETAKAIIRSAIAAHAEAAAADDLKAMATSASDAETGAILTRALAALAVAKGDTAGALATLDQAIRAAPTTGDNYTAKAALLRRLGKLDEARAALDAGIAAGAPRLPLLARRGDVETVEGRTDDAIATYREILSAEPGAMFAANNLTSLLADRKPLDRAELSAARAHLAKLAPPDNPSIVDTLAWADYRLGDTASAKALLERVHADHSAPQLRYHYGAVLMATGDKENGRALIRAALADRFPGDDEAKALVTD